jgi:site-specific DNA-methyltransferase (adenine-specific)
MSASWEIREGDCIEQMRAMEDRSIDAIVTDPPYGIGFMGHEWDQPGEFGPVAPDEDVPLQGGKRRRSQPSAAVGAGHARERKPLHGHGTREGVKFGGPTGTDNTTHNLRGGAMHAGRYDLSPTANQRFQAWCEAWAAEAYRVLKPGGHMLVSGGTRTYHRMTAGIEDAGFEIRDCLSWLYGSGFPKSLDVGKAIDKAAGAERPVVGTTRKSVASMGPGEGAFSDDAYEWQSEFNRTGPATPDAERWQGWGTALKPSWEPIVVARKPFSGTVAANVLEHGTGAINVDGCRIGGPSWGERAPNIGGRSAGIMGDAADHPGGVAHVGGRWPSNVALGHTEDCRMVGERRVATGTAGPQSGGIGAAVVYQPSVSNERGIGDAQGYADEDGMETVEAWDCSAECPVRMLDEQTGELVSGANPTRRGSDKFRTAYGDFAGRVDVEPARGADRGGASRFFYCAKASTAERNAGLAGFEEGSSLKFDPTSAIARDGHRGAGVMQNVHPTVKPIDLMRWLVRLVTPPDGTVLDPFTGSGTTGCAAVREGFSFVGIEREAEYVAIAEARIAWWAEHPEGVETTKLYAAERKRAETAAAGQVGLFDEAAA